MDTGNLKEFVGSKPAKVRRLTEDEAKAAAPYYTLFMANMSREGASIYQVSVDGGKHWADIRPPIGPNCKYSSVPECNAHKQYTAMTTVNCGYAIDLCIRWRMPDGTAYEGCYQGGDLADCKYSGGIWGLTD